jgi:plastocyanin
MARRWATAMAMGGWLGWAACGGVTASPAAPSSPSPPADALVITIVGMNGSQSFSPSPTMAAPGQAIIWRNADSTVHRVVFNDGEIDTGDIAPGGASRTLPLVAPGPYHCSIHPTMVGTITRPE